MQPGNPPRPGWTAPRPPTPNRGPQRPPAPEQAEATQIVCVPPARPAGPPDVFELLGVSDPGAIDVDMTWRPRDAKDAHRTPLGVGPDGTITWLELRGSTGFVIGGGTPEQRSEVLRTVLIGLAVRLSPSSVQFACLSATGSLDGTEHLPQTNLLEKPDETRLNRVLGALDAELGDRADRLRDAGFRTCLTYEQARQDGVDLPPMPLLVLAVEDASELASAHPIFADRLRSLGRSARLTGVVPVCTAAEPFNPVLSPLVLRTSSADESRRWLSRPGAEALASGEALLLSREHDEPHRFRSASSALPHNDLLTRWDIATRKINGLGPQGKPLMLPPVPAASLADHLPPPELTADRGLCFPDLDGTSAFAPVIGTIDLINRYEPLRLDLTEQAHAAIVGRPNSGKSTAVQTFLLSSALIRSAHEVRFHCLDFGGGKLAALEDLPHTRVVTGGYDDGRVDRATRELVDLMLLRERLFARSGIESIDDFDVEAPGARHHVLVVDGWPELAHHPEAGARVLRLARRGGAYGIHVVITAHRWDDLPRELRDLLGHRVELALAAPEDSWFSRALAAEITHPGDALVRNGRCKIARPELDAVSPSELVQRISSAWPHPRPPRLGRPPELVRFKELPAASAKLGLPLGVDDGGDPVSVDLIGDRSPHLLITGGHGAGKSTALRVLIKGITAAYEPSDAMIMIVDLERAHHADLTGSHTLASNRTNEEFGRDLPDALQALRKRLPAKSVTPRQRHDRSWWKGPELFVIIDDYEQLWKSSTRSFVEFAHQAHEIGLHLIIATGSNRPDLLLSTLVAAGAQQLVLGPADEDAPWMSDPAWPKPERPGEAVHAELPRGCVNGPLRVAWVPDPLAPDAGSGDG